MPQYVQILFNLADGLKHAKNATSIFFGNSTLEGLSTEEVLTAMEPTSQMFHVSPDELFGTPLIKLLAKNGIVTSICKLPYNVDQLRAPLIRSLHLSSCSKAAHVIWSHPGEQASC